MSDSIEMQDLSNFHARNTTSADPVLQDAGTGHRVNVTDDAMSVWAWTSAAVFALFSTCLLASPRLLLFLAEPSGGRGTLTPLEKYLAFLLGIVLGTLAVTIIAMLPNEWPTGLQPRADPNCHPLLRPVTAASLAMAFLSYENHSVGTLTTTVLLASGIVGLSGLWMLIFSGPSAISTKTGADKHTSSFIFGNTSAASVRKRLRKRDHSN